MIRLEQLRKEKKMSMSKCAAVLQVPYTTYVSWEKGAREPNSEMLIVLADFFGCSIDYLVGRSPARINIDVQQFKLKKHTEGEQRTLAAAFTNALSKKVTKAQDPKQIETAQDKLKKEAENMTTAELVECLGIVQKELEKKSQGSGA